MASKYWIKLYHEILDDPKMGRLDDRLFRRTIELFLLAGECDENGFLPGVPDISWRLRTNEESLETEMIELQKVGILSVQNGRWIVTKFSERQAAVSVNERVARFRQRKRQEEYYGTQEERDGNADVTIRYTDTDTDTDTEQDIDKEKEKTTTTSSRGLDPEFGALCNVYEKNIGHLTPMLAEDLAEDLADYGLQTCMDAISEALRRNKRQWAYIQGILKNWKRDGRNGTGTEAKNQDEQLAVFVVGNMREIYSNGKLIRTETVME